MTGTFDDWSKSEKLEKVGDIFEKNVTLPDASKKIYYKVRRCETLCRAELEGQLSSPEVYELYKTSASSMECIKRPSGTCRQRLPLYSAHDALNSKEFLLASLRVNK